MKNSLLVVTLSLAILSGCSSIVSKSDYDVVVASTPTGANFVITNKAGLEVQRGVTPSTVSLKSSAGYFKGEAYTVVFNKEGFPPRTYDLTSSIDGWYFGNIVLGGLIGMLIVDPITGAMFNLPDRIDVSLDEEVSFNDANTLIIATIDALDQEQRSRLVRIN